MKFAFSRPTRSQEEQRLLFESFRAVGYAGLQLKAGQYLPYIDEPQRFLDEWGQQPGVAAGLIFYHPLDDEGCALLRKCFSFGAQVGTEQVIFVDNQPRAGDTTAQIRQSAALLSALGKEARDQGITLTLHHHFNQPVMHREEIALFFDAAQAGVIGLTVDTAHLVKSGIQDVPAILRDFRPVIANLHLKDYADGEWRVLGHGKIDFNAIFAALKEIGYDGWVCADEESGGDLIRGMEECYRFMNERD